MSRRSGAWTVGLALVLAVAGCAASYEQTNAYPTGRSPGSEVSISFFYDNLSPYGQWFDDPSYGWCWTPYDVSADWRPYWDGHWEYTDFGWSWASNEPWGWGPYHYGRWFFDADYGWAWMPGTEWAPAWVAWRYSDEWVGWAPLPPAAVWNASIGLTFTNAGAIPPPEWCFVPQRHLLDGSLRVQVTSVARNVTLLPSTRDMTRIEPRGNRPANVGVDVALVQRSLGRPVPRVKIADVDSPSHGRGQPAAGGAVGFYRPTVRPKPGAEAPAPVVADRHDQMSEEAMQRQRDERQRKLEGDLNSERARLQRDQQNELRGRAPGPDADQIRQRQAAEQQAFEAHVAEQRRVMQHRMQQQVVPPGKGKSVNKTDNSHKNKGQGRSGG